jgi:hypothetical protein
MKQWIFLVSFLVIATTSTQAQTKTVMPKKANEKVQVAFGFTLANDLYHRYTNPVDNKLSPSAGSAILNFGGGPKLWIGNKSTSFSLEGSAMWGIIGLSSKDYKGLGTLAVPLMAKLNFRGLSTFDREGKLGLSIGGGIQYHRTELYGLSDEARNLSIRRPFHQTYIAQVGYGWGVSGFTVVGFGRYGWNTDLKINTLSVGIQYDLNLKSTKNISNPESEL